MLKPSTVVWAALAIAAGGGLFLMKYDVRALEGRLVSLDGEIARNHQAIHVLKAEWAYLNKPERLAALAERHLDLVPLAADQIIPLEAIPRRTAEQRQIAEAGSGAAAPVDGADR